jgi:hypothetical protein
VGAMDSVGQPTRPHRLRIDLAELADALGCGAEEVSAYLDLDTGEVVWVTPEDQRELEVVEAEYLQDLVDPQVRGEALAASAEQRGLPSWMMERLHAADLVEAGLGTRFIRVHGRTPATAMRTWVSLGRAELGYAVP